MAGTAVDQPVSIRLPTRNPEAPSRKWRTARKARFRGLRQPLRQPRQQRHTPQHAPPPALERAEAFRRAIRRQPPRRQRHPGVASVAPVRKIAPRCEPLTPPSPPGSPPRTRRRTPGDGAASAPGGSTPAAHPWRIPARSTAGSRAAGTRSGSLRARTLDFEASSGLTRGWRACALLLERPSMYRRSLLASSVTLSGDYAAEEKPTIRQRGESRDSHRLPAPMAASLGGEIGAFLSRCRHSSRKRLRQKGLRHSAGLT